MAQKISRPNESIKKSRRNGCDLTCIFCAVPSSLAGSLAEKSHKETDRVIKTNSKITKTFHQIF